MDRRQFLATISAVALAGCGGDGGGTDTPAGDTLASPTPSPTPDAAATPTESGGQTPTATDAPGAGADPSATATDAPSATPSPSPTPSPTPAPAREFTGSSQDVVEDVDVMGGLTIVEATHDGESNFQVEFVPDGDQTGAYFVNEIGGYDGASAELVEAGTFIVDVNADGAWSLTITEPRPSSGDGLPQSFEGSGPIVRGPFAFDGTHTATGTHDGESNFIVTVYPLDGFFGNPIINEIGEFDGETAFEHDGIGFVEVNADGNWSLEME